MMLPLSTTEFAPAKVNLSLHVTGLRDDGYHLLDSLVVFCDVGDHITATVASTTALTLTGFFAHEVPQGHDNLVMRAARAFAGDIGLAIALEKNLPVASGLGGGSADAAAVIRAVLRLRRDHDLTARTRAAAGDTAAVLALGADVPVCLGSRPARMRGIGETVDRLGAMPDCCIVLVNPGLKLATPDVFRGLVAKANGPMPDRLPHWPDARSLAAWLSTTRNDLEEPARRVAPVIGDVLGLLRDQPGALIARMSGSGATCFALFETRARAVTAAAAISRARPAWWSVAGAVIGASDDVFS
ncbi:MAG: 4-(cytidine 5'-diphospho)-2-C-methyl-D-erythritol kinase [Pseudomonadota bacterium]